MSTSPCCNVRLGRLSSPPEVSVEEEPLDQVRVALKGFVREYARGNLVRQRLADAVDLVVVATTREGEEFGFELIKPRRRSGKTNLAAFELAGLDRHPGPFVQFRL